MKKFLFVIIFMSLNLYALPLQNKLTTFVKEMKETAPNHMLANLSSLGSVFFKVEANHQYELKLALNDVQYVFFCVGNKDFSVSIKEPSGNVFGNCLSESGYLYFTENIIEQGIYTLIIKSKETNTIGISWGSY